MKLILLPTSDLPRILLVIGGKGRVVVQWELMGGTWYIHWWNRHQRRWNPVPNHVLFVRQFYRIKSGGGWDRVGFILNIGKNILISRRYEQSSRNDRGMTPKWLQTGCSKKFQTFKIAL